MSDGIIIHGGQLVRRWNRPDVPPIADGALYAEGGRVVATGTLPELIARWPRARRIGGSHLSSSRASSTRTRTGAGSRPGRWARPTSRSTSG